MDTNSRQEKKDPEYRKFILSRIILGLAAAIVLLWAAAYIAGSFEPPEKPSEKAAEEGREKQPAKPSPDEAETKEADAEKDEKAR